MVDLTAPIIPGKSAAGFHLGQHYTKLDFDGMAIATWHRTDPPLFDVILGTVGWLRINSDDILLEKTGRYSLRYCHGAIMLQFTSHHLIYNIAVYDGYLGSFQDTIRIGSRLVDVTKYMELSYDPGDEMHYPAEGSDVRGIGFVAAEVPLEAIPDQVISGISVNDWQLLRGD